LIPAGLSTLIAGQIIWEVLEVLLLRRWERKIKGLLVICETSDLIDADRGLQLPVYIKLDKKRLNVDWEAIG